VDENGNLALIGRKVQTVVKQPKSKAVNRGSYCWRTDFDSRFALNPLCPLAALAVASLEERV
jgi:hypothetical protein